MLSKKNKNDNSITSIIHDNQFVDIFSLDETKVQDPAFHTLKEARNKIFTKQYQSQPIFDSDGNIIAVFQLEAKYRSILQATDTRLAI